MKSRRGFLLVFTVCLLAGAIAATQFVGWSYGYDPRLGWSIASVDHHTVYWPIAFFIWMLTLPQSGQAVTNDAGLIFILSMLPVAVLMVWSVRSERQEIRSFAPNAWGKKLDAKQAGLLHPNHEGVIVGRWGRAILGYAGPEHQLVSGASRSGKGAGHVIPTLLNYHESVFVYDPKAECYDITGRFRKQFSHTFWINMTRRDTAAYNPLDAVRKGDKEIADIQNIVSILHDPAGTKTEPTFFDRAAMQVLTALILHVLYARPPAQKNLAGVRAAIMQGDRTIMEMTVAGHRYKQDPAQADGRARDAAGKPIVESIREVQLVGQRLLAMPARLRGDILETALSYLSIWADPIVAEMTSRSDFTAGDLVCSDHPVSLYLQVPPSDDDRLKPLTRLLLSQIASLLMTDLSKDAEGRPKRHRLLFLIDEFPSLGRLGFFSRNMRVMAGYGIKVLLTVQSFKDIIDAYGANNTIIDNCHIIVAFASADNETARKISEMLGEPVEQRSSYSQSTGGKGVFSGRYTRSRAEAQRKLLEPGEVRQLPYDTQLVLVTGSKPFKARKIRYWLEKPWAGRAANIRNGELGPSQKDELDVPRPGGVKSIWQSIEPLNVTLGTAPTPNQDDEPVQEATTKIRDLGLGTELIREDADMAPENI